MKTSLFHTLFPAPKYLSMPAWGVDISDDGVRGSEFLSTHSLCRPRATGFVPLEKGVVVDGAILKPDLLAEALHTLSTRFHSKFVYASLPDEKAFLFQTHLTKTELENTRETLEFRLEENVPLSAKDAVFEYWVSNKEQDGKYEAVVSVVPKDVVLSYTSALAMASLTPLSFELSAHAVVRSILHPHDERTVLLVHSSANKTTTAIVSMGAIRFLSTIPSGTLQSTEAISRAYTISLDEAKALKRKYGFLKEHTKEDVFFSLISASSPIKDELTRITSFWTAYRDRHSGVPEISAIIVCGDEVDIPSYDEYISLCMGLPTSIANVWTNICPVGDDFIPSLMRRDALTFGVSFGLSLESIHRNT